MRVFRRKRRWSAFGAVFLLGSLMFTGRAYALTTANDDVASTDVDVAVDISVLTNDTTDGTPLVIVANDNPSTNGGTVTCDADSCLYTPPSGFTGGDTFNYSAGGSGGEDFATVSVTVSAPPPPPPNSPPTAVDDVATTAVDVPVDVPVIANDTDPDAGDTLSVSAGGPASANGGTVACDADSCLYTPPGGFSGGDTFTYSVTDGTVDDAGAVSVTVSAPPPPPPPNSAPTAVNDAATTDEDVAVDVPVIANDTDPDAGDVLSVSGGGPTSANGGTVACDANSCLYTPPSGFTGGDSFTYSVTDGVLEDVGSVSVTVTAVSSPPTTPPTTTPAITTPTAPAAPTTSPPATAPPTTTAPVREATTPTGTSVPPSRPKRAIEAPRVFDLATEQLDLSSVAMPVVEATTAGGPTVQESRVLGTSVTRTEPERHRSILARIPLPSDLDLSARHIAQNIALTLTLVLLVACPAALFDSTLQGNYAEISGWFCRGRQRVKRAQELLARLPSVVGIALYAMWGSAIYGFLDPDFGLDRASATAFVGLALAILAISSTYDVVRSYYVHRLGGERGHLVLYPLGLLVGIVFVVASRASDFHPGYVFGIFTAVAYTRRVPDDRAAGQGLAVASVLLLALATTAWFASIPVAAAAEKADAAFAVLVLDAMLAFLWVAGLQAIVFGLLPMRFMNGQKVWTWSRRGWAAIWLVGVFGFVSALVHPKGGVYGTSPDASYVSVMLLFAAFAALSVTFWAYFRFRPQPHGAAARVSGGPLSPPGGGKSRPASAPSTRRRGRSRGPSPA